MGYAELINQRLQTLPQEKQAEVYDFVEFIATRGSVTEMRDEAQQKKRVMDALAAARSAWLKMGANPGDHMASDLRAQWDDRGWESPR